MSVVQILLLVIASVLAVTAIIFMVMFLLKLNEKEQVEEQVFSFEEETLQKNKEEDSI